MRRLKSLAAVILVAAATAGCTQTDRLTESEAIPFKTVKQDDPTRLAGETSVAVPGEAGVKTVVYEETYRWGSKLGRQKLEETLELKPQDEIVKVGTRKALTFTINAPGAGFEINIDAAGRRPEGYGAGRARIPGDALIIKGTVKNNGTKPVKPGGPIDLAVAHPALNGGLVMLATAGPGSIGPGQTAAVEWAGSLNNGKPGANPAIGDLGQLSIIPRAFVGPKNAINGQMKPIAGLPAI